MFWAEFSAFALFSMENNDGLWWLMVDVGDGESTWNFRNGFAGYKRSVQGITWLLRWPM